MNLKKPTKVILREKRDVALRYARILINNV